MRSFKDLETVGPHWESASAHLLSPMQSLEWVRTCAEVFLPQSDVKIFTVGVGSDIAIAPLYRSRRQGVRLEMIGERQLFEATDFVYSTASDIDALARSMAAAKLPLRFERVLADSPVIEALRRQLNRRAYVICREAPGVPYISLDESWLEPETHLSARRRSDFRRARRNAENIGPITLDILSPSPEELHSLLQEAYGVEAQSWKAKEGSALSIDVLRGEFFRRYAQSACNRGNLRICFLRIGGQAAAMQIAVVHSNRFWLLKIGYSDGFSRGSPGTLLMRETIRYAAKLGLSSYEFLGQQEPWIEIWTNRVRPCISLLTHPYNLFGITTMALDFAKVGIKGLQLRIRGSA
jgi:CelD/BcsL family acetyltransferase involved in cellulose biosynthesis